MDSVRFRPATDIAADTEALRQRLQDALGSSAPDARAIHRLRVTCKRLRSLVRLCRHDGNDKHWRRYDHALRDTAAAFGPVRDRKVLQDTLTLLQARTRSKRTQAACRQLLAQLSLQPGTDCVRDRAAEKLASSAFPAAALTVKRLERGLHRTFKRCSKLAQYAIAGGTDATTLHTLRKQVKYLGYQLELAALPAAAMTRQRKRLGVLGSLLGVMHDLAVLEQQLSTGLGGAAADKLLVATLAARQRQQMLERAARLSVRLSPRE